MLLITITVLANEVRKGDRALGALNTTIQLNEQAAKHRIELATAVKSAQEQGQNERDSLTVQLQEKDNELFRRSVNAEAEATSDPYAFGDDFVADIINLDCLWSLGERQGDNSARAACLREAKLASTTGEIVPVTIINKDFRNNWVAACNNWTTIGTSKATIEEDPDGDLRYTVEDWKDEFPTFNSELCNQTVVAFTPAFSFYFRRFLQNGENYTAKLANFARDNRRLLDVITAIPKKEPEQ